MSWSGWSARLNVTSIVSQGLEQVSKLKEDVEKQFDQAVQGAKAAPPSFSSGYGASFSTASSSSGPDLFGDASPDVKLPPQSADAAPILKTVDDINVIKPTQWGDLASSAAANGAAGDVPMSKLMVQQPPYSAGGKRRPNAGPPLDFLTVHAPLDVENNASDSNKLLSEESTTEKEEEKVAVAAESELSSFLVHGEASAKPKDGAVENGEQESGDNPTTPATNEGDSMATWNDGEGSEEAAKLEKAEDDEDEEKEGATVDNDDSDTTTNDDELNVPAAVVATDDDDAESEDDVAPSAVTIKETSKDQPAEDSDISLEQGHVDAQDSTPEMAGDERSHDATLAAKEKEIRFLHQQLKAREDQLMATSSSIQELHDELDKTCQREVTAVERARYLTEQLELMRHEVTKLNRMAAGQRDSDFQAMQHALSEKDEKLKALLEEGQALSIKQAQFEQRVRQLRKEKNEEEEMRLKIESQYETITVQFQDQSAKLKSIEEENKKYAQQLRQLQTTVDTATTQLTKSENTVAAYEKQMEQLNSEVEELSQSNGDMQQKLDALKHASHSNEALSSEKAELEQTIHFLHQSLRDLEEESIRREEMARSEIANLKKKWQGAVSRVDMMGQSVSEATQPLLRQIHALQEDQRARQETWKATEAALQLRIQQGIDLRRDAEAVQLQKEEEIHTLQTRIEAAEKELKRRESELTREKEKCESAITREHELRAQLDAMQVEIDEWKVKYNAEVHAKEQLLLRLNNERNKKVDLHTPSTARDTELEEAKAREEQLRHDLEWNQNEVRRLKTLVSKTGSASNGLGSGGRTFSPMGSSSSHRSSFDDSSSTGHNNYNETQASILKQTLAAADDDSLLGSASVLGFSQLQQKLRLREGENRLVKQQMGTLEAKQAQLTEEIVRLSTRNALLETNEARFQQTQEELLDLKQRQHVLLELFGEKEEQVEELQSEVSELKAFYRKQLDTLAKHQAQQ
uniref:TATA element modulatory factor 1 TATA binding domain-containing protein n=1 Tax=Globisporangium ultimum (strain ATCC 200006 / CBS 805.95 / DAOM BR144) TaxID=431595 RepID=K3WPE1_GLOUD